MPYSKFKDPWHDNTGDVVNAAFLNQIEQAVYDLKTTVFNVKDYGAVGDGTTDDSTAINAAITAAANIGGGIVHFPSGHTYAIMASIVLKDDVTVAIPPGATIKWMTATTGAMFTQSTAGTVNFRQAVVGVGGKGKIDPNLIDVTVFDLHSPQMCQIGDLWIGPGGAASTVVKIRCDVTTPGGIGGTGYIAAWNYIHDIHCHRCGTFVDAQGTASDACITDSTFRNLYCNDVRVKGFQVGPHMDTNHVIGHFYVSLGENNAIGVDFANDASTVDNVFDYCIVETFPGWTGRIGVRFGAAGARNVLRWYTNNPAAEAGPIIGSGTSWKIEAGNWVEASLSTNALSTISRATKKIHRYQGLAYSASMTPDANLASPDVIFEIFVTNGTAFTMNAPTNPCLGDVITFNFANISGGAMGAITWNGIYFLSSAFAGGPSGTYRSISFFYNNSHWVETARSG